MVQRGESRVERLCNGKEHRIFGDLEAGWGAEGGEGRREMARKEAGGVGRGQTTQGLVGHMKVTRNH